MSSKIKKSSILHASGKKLVMLGGDVWDQRVTGDIISEFKWIDGEPAMLIYKSVLGKNTQAYMIEMKDAHQFALSNGQASKRLLNELCFGAAKALNSEYDKATVHRLITVILDGLPDMLRMPPEPTELEKANRPSTGNDEISIKIDGKTIIETVV